jgi:hypothetical protein
MCLDVLEWRDDRCDYVMKYRHSLGLVVVNLEDLWLARDWLIVPTPEEWESARSELLMHCL